MVSRQTGKKNILAGRIQTSLPDSCQSSASKKQTARQSYIYPGQAESLAAFVSVKQPEWEGKKKNETFKDPW